MSMDDIGSPSTQMTLPDVQSYGSFTATTVFNGTSYGTYVELVSAAENTDDRLITGVTMLAYRNAYGPELTSLPVYVKIGTGTGGAETTIANDLPAVGFLELGTYDAAAGKELFPYGILVPSGTRIAAASRQRVAPTGGVNCIVVVTYLLRNAITS